MLNKVSVFFVATLSVVVSGFCWRIDHLNQQIKLKNLDIATQQAQLTTVTQINNDLNTTIESLTQHIKDERSAVDFMKNYTAAVDANVNKAVNDLKGLLNENDNCGNQRLPQSVIDRMWIEYSNKSRDKNS